MSKKPSTEAPTDDTGDVYDFLPHPLAEVYPLIEGEEFETLVKDIEDNGLIEAITLFEGKILDGRNRYNACRKIKGFKFGKHDFRNLPTDKEKVDALSFVISKNSHRRHLTQDQKRGCNREARWHPDDIDQFRRKWRAAVTEGTPFEAESRFRAAHHCDVGEVPALPLRGYRLGARCVAFLRP